MLTVAQCVRHIDHTLDSDDFGVEGAVGLINDAGTFLATAHPWKWLERPPSQVTLTSSQAYILLPADFGALLAYENHTQYGLELVDFQTLVEARTNGGSPTTGAGYIAAIAHAVASDGSLTPRIEIYPTPSATVAVAGTIIYRGTWRSIVTGDEEKQVLTIPGFMEPLFKLVLRDFARGYEEEDVARLDQRLEATMASIVARTAKSRDGAIQPDYGPLANGAAAAARRAADFRSGTVAAPS